MSKPDTVSMKLGILSCITSITFILASLRIKKARKAIVVNLATIPIYIILQSILPFPFGIGVSWIATLAIFIYFIRKWVNDWNKKQLSVLK